MAGSFDTKPEEKSSFDFDLKIERLSIPESYKHFMTIQMLAPVAEIMEGNFSSDFRLAGKGINSGAASFMIPPTVTTSERVGLNTAGKEGALIFNSTTKKFQGYDGTTWHDLH